MIAASTAQPISRTARGDDVREVTEAAFVARLGLAVRARRRCRARRRPVIASGNDSSRARSPWRAPWDSRPARRRILFASGPTLSPRRKAPRRRRGSSCSRAKTRCGPGSSAEALVWTGDRGGAAAVTGDVLVLTVRLREPHGYVEARAGRFVLATGAVHPVQIDGAHVIARAPWGSTVETFGGLPVVPRFGARSYDWLAGGRVAQTVAERSRARRLLRAAARGRRDLGRRGRCRRRDGSRALARRRGVRRLRPHEPRPRGGSRVGRAAHGATGASSCSVRSSRQAGCCRRRRSSRCSATCRRTRSGRPPGGGPRPASTCSRAARGRTSRAVSEATDGCARRCGSTTRATAASGSRCAAWTSPARSGRACAPSPRLPLGKGFRYSTELEIVVPDAPGRTRRRLAVGALGAVVAIRSTGGSSQARSRRRRRRSTATRPTPSCASRTRSTVASRAPSGRAPGSRPPDEDAPPAARGAAGGAGGLRERARSAPRVAVAPVRAPRARAQGHQLRRVPRRRGARGRDGRRCTFRRDADCRQCHQKPHDDRSCIQCHGEPYVRQAAELARAQLRFEHSRHMGAVDGDCVRCHTEVAEARPQTILPKMATLLRVPRAPRAVDAAGLRRLPRRSARRGLRPPTTTSFTTETSSASTACARRARAISARAAIPTASARRATARGRCLRCPGSSPSAT